MSKTKNINLKKVLWCVISEIITALSVLTVEIWTLTNVVARFSKLVAKLSQLFPITTESIILRYFVVLKKPPTPIQEKKNVFLFA